MVKKRIRGVELKEDIHVRLGSRSPAALGTLALPISLLPGTHAMLGQDPPVHRQLHDGSPSPQVALYAKPSNFPPVHCQGSQLQTVVGYGLTQSI
jgi:hypothetical protein